jgi:hypothetical protein
MEWALKKNLLIEGKTKVRAIGVTITGIDIGVDLRGTF